MNSYRTAPSVAVAFRYAERSARRGLLVVTPKRRAATLDKGPRTARVNVRLNAGRIDAVGTAQRDAPRTPTLPASRQPGGFLLGREPALGRQMIDHAR